MAAPAAESACGPVICLAGPTGSGKTALALELASRYGCEIINADSRQAYADFPIVTAQPGVSEFSLCSHHLYGFLEISEKISAGQWAQLAAAKCREIESRGRIPLLVGGTGFYFAAFLHGLAEIPPVPAEVSSHFAGRLSSEGSQNLYQELSRLDPVYAAKIHPADRQRIQRALEVHAATGRIFTWWHEHLKPTPFAKGPLLVLAADLAWLEPRLLARIDAMLANGAIEEIQKAARKNPVGPGWSGIGCREIRQYLTEGLSLPQCRKNWHANTRAYAKRQLTWFRARKEAIWITPQYPGQALSEACACIDKLF